jgi:broad specificity phosphatase PhoE
MLVRVLVGILSILIIMRESSDYSKIRGVHFPKSVQNSPNGVKRERRAKERMLGRIVTNVTSLPRWVISLVLRTWRRLVLPKFSTATPAVQVHVKDEPKTLLLVRHGQSMHNISDVAKYGDQGADSTLFDAPLSPLGETQVAALAANRELAVAELVITSPLTRAVQTMFGAYPSLARGLAAKGERVPRIEAWALVTEHLTDSCDIGSGSSELRARYPQIASAFDSLPEVWWYTDDETSRKDPEESRAHYRDNGFMEPEATLIQRVDAFVDALRARPERVIAVFGHSDYVRIKVTTRVPCHHLVSFIWECLLLSILVRSLTF